MHAQVRESHAKAAPAKQTAAARAIAILGIRFLGTMAVWEERCAAEDDVDARLATRVPQGVIFAASERKANYSNNLLNSEGPSVVVQGPVICRI